MTVSATYPPTHRDQHDGVVTEWIVRQPFLPDRELEMTW
jgi:hypothetical protein